MTKLLFRDDAYVKDADAVITGISEEGAIILDQSLFYPTSGGQPGDSGRLTWDGGELDIATTSKGREGEVLLLPSAPAPLPSVGQSVRQTLNWDRRYRHMRMHTALHLLSVIIPLPVTGGAISSEKGRLDFAMPDPPEDKTALESSLNRLIACKMDVTEEWISPEALADQPELVKTMSVQPPTGTMDMRLIRIGVGSETADLQPCGGTHVSNTAEIGPVRIGKIEKKGRLNRRVHLYLEH